MLPNDTSYRQLVVKSRLSPFPVSAAIIAGPLFSNKRTANFRFTALSSASRIINHLRASSSEWTVTSGGLLFGLVLWAQELLDGFEEVRLGGIEREPRHRGVLHAFDSRLVQRAIVSSSGCRSSVSVRINPELRDQPAQVH